MLVVNKLIIFLAFDFNYTKTYVNNLSSKQSRPSVLFLFYYKLHVVTLLINR